MLNDCETSSAISLSFLRNKETCCDGILKWLASVKSRETQRLLTQMWLYVTPLQLIKKLMERNFHGGLRTVKIVKTRSMSHFGFVSVNWTLSWLLRSATLHNAELWSNASHLLCCTARDGKCNFTMGYNGFCTVPDFASGALLMCCLILSCQGFWTLIQSMHVHNCHLRLG